MLFNSFLFIFIFLPTVLLIHYYMVRRKSASTILGFLTLASLCFYTYWYPPYLVLLLVSICLNYICGILIEKGKKSPIRKAYLTLGIVCNLGLLCYYKYAGFFVENINTFSGGNWPVLQIALPLGISFFTFQQLIYLVDVYKQKVRPAGFVEYTLFVSFFPHLIAGPILHYKELVPQFHQMKEKGFQSTTFSAGLALFSIGLFKKIILADTLALHVDPLFKAVENGYTPSFLEAWAATIAYCFQIYFDFSGYTDMAIGLALLFGIKLPCNFNAPYKATGYIEFWRRWHITLSNFLRDYLYIPLGGNRKGGLRKYQNLIITMLIGGLWHGASWNFVLWGGFHGMFIALNHGLRHYFYLSAHSWRAVGWLLTFLTVTLLWVLFRAESISGATAIYKGLFDFSNVIIPQNVWLIFPEIAQICLSQIGIGSGELQYFKTVPLFFIISLVTFITFMMPNTARLFDLNVPERDTPLLGSRWHFQPNKSWAIMCAVLFIMAITLLERESPFVYFQF
ncbi:MAG: MBOAT family protein [Micavibrio aeruginosavorus]|uniref:MBOAT family protein n=1 Tax=Micavibrio aeruginosavorus TaxID=349221 RepID=A0A7T5UFN7_9BACT|nr:MAG: MBOAT family protein [Micavibrio aeruginosavorus]